MCCSMFANKSVFKSTFLYMITVYDPVFFLMPILSSESENGAAKKFQSLDQILEQGLDNYDKGLEQR